MGRVLAIVYRTIATHLINKAGVPRNTARTGERNLGVRSRIIHTILDLTLLFPRTSIRVRRILGGLTGDRLRTPFILPILIPGMPLMVDICRGIHQVIHYRIGNIKNLLLRHFLEIHFRVVNSTNRI
jgi:hypothetical protein